MQNSKRKISRKQRGIHKIVTVCDRLEIVRMEKGQKNARKKKTTWISGKKKKKSCERNSIVYSYMSLYEAKHQCKTPSQWESSGMKWATGNAQNTYELGKYCLSFSYQQ